MNYAWDLSQSETEKYLEKIIMLVVSSVIVLVRGVKFFSDHEIFHPHHKLLCSFINTCRNPSLHFMIFFPSKLFLIRKNNKLN